MLSLKGLSRDWKAQVGEYSLDALIAVLQIDAKEDGDIGKAALETLVILCDTDATNTEPTRGTPKVANDDLGLKHTDVFLAVSHRSSKSSTYFRVTELNMTCVPGNRHPSLLILCYTCSLEQSSMSVSSLYNSFLSSFKIDLRRCNSTS